MLTLTLRNLAARKIRLVMSAFAIVLGIAFLAGSFVFTDTLEKSFSAIATDTVPSVSVRSVDTDTENVGVTVAQSPLDAALVDELAGVEGVERADGDVQGVSLFVVSKENKLLGGTGAPTLTFNHHDAPNAAGEKIIDIVEGRAPQGADEVVLDSRSAERAGYVLGDTVSMITVSDDPQVKAELVGIAEFGAGSLAGATLVLFDTPTAQDLFLEGRDQFTSISLTAAEGVTQTELADRVEPLLPDGFEAVTGTEQAEETQGLIDTVMGFLSTFLLVFAGVALVVGTFLIVNTFSILVAQRSRELALLRALGATRSQIAGSVIGEAFVVGLIGSVIGIAVGIGLAMALKGLFGEFGLDLSGADLVIHPRTFAVSLVVGTVVTMVAAYLPAHRATRIAPVQAMRDEIAMPESSLTRRLVVAIVCTVLGAAGMTAGLVLDVPRPAIFVGVGVFFVLMAVTAAAPFIAVPVVGVARAVYGRLFGQVGRLAAENARRNPRRTAATASALMIGLALVTSMGVLGASINATIDDGVDEQFAPDYLVSSAVFQPFSTAIAKDIARVDGVASVVTSETVEFDAPAGSARATATDTAAFADLFDVPWIDGAMPTGPDQIAFREFAAKWNNAVVGEDVRVVVAGQERELEVTGIYPDDQYTVDDAIVSTALLEEVGAPRAHSSVSVVLEEDAPRATVALALDRIVEDNLTVTVQDKEEFAEAQRAQVNQLLYLIYALLGLAIIIAVLGIINTLSLSVIERTREVGLLRALGLTRRQLRRMIRLEAIAIAVLGAVLGIGAGLLFGVALQRAFADEGIEVLRIPVGQLGVFVVVSVLVGVVAAVIPAWRAARLDVLNAISTQ